MTNDQGIIDHGIKINALVSIFLTCAVISFALRVYVRTRIIKSFGADDIWMAFALIVYIANSACNFLAVHYGLTRPASEGFVPTTARAVEFWWLCNLTYCTAMVLVKTSVGIFLLRFALDVMYRWVLYCAMAANVLIGVIFFALGLVMCIPVRYIWDHTDPNGGRCLTPETLLVIVYVNSVVSVIVDFVFALSPIFLMWRLNLSLRTRVLLIPIFSLACVASIAVLIRFAYVNLLDGENFLHLATDFAFWCDVESGLAIFAANLATLRPFFRKIGINIGCSASRESARARFNRMKLSSIRPQQWAGGFVERNSKARGNHPHILAILKGDREKRVQGTVGEDLQRLQPIHLHDEKWLRNAKTAREMNSQQPLTVLGAEIQ